MFYSKHIILIQLEYKESTTSSNYVQIARRWLIATLQIVILETNRFIALNFFFKFIAS